MKAFMQADRNVRLVAQSITEAIALEYIFNNKPCKACHCLKMPVVLDLSVIIKELQAECDRQKKTRRLIENLIRTD